MKAEDDLSRTWQTFLQHWHNTKGRWDDEMRYWFESDVIEALQRETTVVIEEIRRLGTVLAQAQREVR